MYWLSHWTGDHQGTFASWWQAGVQETKLSCTSPFQTFAHIISVNTPLAKASHVTILKPRSREVPCPPLGHARVCLSHVITRGEESTPVIQPALGWALFICSVSLFFLKATVCRAYAASGDIVLNKASLVLALWDLYSSDRKKSTKELLLSLVIYFQLWSVQRSTEHQGRGASPQGP